MKKKKKKNSIRPDARTLKLLEVVNEKKKKKERTGQQSIGFVLDQ